MCDKALQSLDLLLFKDCAFQTIQQCGKDDGVEDAQLGTGRDLPLVPEDATEGLECFRGFANSGGLSYSHPEQCC